METDDGDARSRGEAVFQRGLSGSHMNRIAATVRTCKAVYKGAARYSAAFPCTSCPWQAPCGADGARSAARHSSKQVLAAAATSRLAQGPPATAACSSASVCVCPAPRLSQRVPKRR